MNPKEDQNHSQSFEKKSRQHQSGYSSTNPERDSWMSVFQAEALPKSYSGQQMRKTSEMDRTNEAGQL